MHCRRADRVATRRYRGVVAGSKACKTGGNYNGANLMFVCTESKERQKGEKATVLSFEAHRGACSCCRGRREFDGG